MPNICSFTNFLQFAPNSLRSFKTPGDTKVIQRLIWNMKFLSSRGRQTWTKCPKISNSCSSVIFLSTGLKASRMMWHPAQNTFMILFYFFGIAPQGGARKGHVVRLENKLRLCFTDRPQTKPRILEALWRRSTSDFDRQSLGLICPREVVVKSFMTMSGSGRRWRNSNLWGLVVFDYFKSSVF